MHAVLYSDPAEYRRIVMAALGALEAENALLLGVAGQLVEQPGRYPLPPVLLTINDETGLRLTALQTPPLRMLLSGALGPVEPAAEALVGALDERGIRIPGVNGPAQSATAAVEAWVRVHGEMAHLHTRLRAYTLTRVYPPWGVPGALRLALQADLELAAEWEYSFNLEALGTASHADALKRTQARIAAGQLYLWQDSRLVSMASTTRPLQRGISIGGVYTPPEHRRHGYASACVAALSELMLGQGWQYCALFTNLANPVSNHIYQVIGYRAAGDYLEYDLD